MFDTPSIAFILDFPYIVKNISLRYLKLPLTILIILFADKAFSQVEFIQNKGQWDSKARFMSAAGNGAFFLENNGFTVVQHNEKELERIIEGRHSETPASNTD